MHQKTRVQELERNWCRFVIRAEVGNIGRLENAENHVRQLDSVRVFLLQLAVSRN
jgi:hypothetical protein